MKPIQFKCLKCGRCCRKLYHIADGIYKGLTFYSDKLDLFPRNLIFPSVGLGKSPDKIEFIREYQLNTHICPHIDEDNNCKIYRKRPLSCRRFPLIEISDLEAGVAFGRSCMFIEKKESKLGELNQVFTPNTFIYEEGWLTIKQIYGKIKLLLIDAQLLGLQIYTFDLAYNKWILLDDVVPDKLMR